GGTSKLERKFLGPFVERVFGDVPELDYVTDLRRKQLPANIRDSEFFFKAGDFLNDPVQQQNYVCSNYTYAVRDLIDNGVNVVAQMVAKREIDGKTWYSLSCNPDLALDMMPLLRDQAAQGRAVAVIGEVNRQLPFMVNDAMVPADNFDMIIDSVKLDYPLFSVPNMAISPAEHLIGLYASTLIRDGGTLQIGIGSLGSALVYSTILRHTNNALYRRICADLDIESRFPVVTKVGDQTSFEQGLYGCSEMLVDGFMHLYRAGVLQRQVYSDYRLQRL